MMANITRSMPVSSDRIIVGLSGGVDSSVSAALLQQAGFEVHGLFMKNWEEDDTDDFCAAAVDIQDAQKVCQCLNISFHQVNFSVAYWEKVFENFLSEYARGYTPNPDILCNKEIKFNLFLEYALNLGAQFIATGHYASRQIKENEICLFKSSDLNKDQTYFLYGINQHALKHTIFPLEKLTKTSVRKMAHQFKLPNFAKKDSTGICFIGKKKFNQFLKRYLLTTPGIIETVEGKPIGTHEGIFYYTIGQRQGLKIGGKCGYDQLPWYVVHKELKSNRLIVAQGKNHPALFSRQLVCDQINWIGSPPTDLNHVYKAKIRYRQIEQACLIIPQPYKQQSPDINNLIVKNNNPVTRYLVNFEDRQWAATLGQSIVFYDKDHCLGGGIICDVIN